MNRLFSFLLSLLIYIPVNGIKHLELEIIYCHSTSEEIVDDFIWLLPDLETLSLTLNSTTEFIEI